MLLAACPKEHLPTAGAVAQVLTNIAVSIGPLLGAALTRAVDIRTALLVITVLQVLSVGCFLLLPTREQERAGE
jgi:predicted MFS family arabinose efflux permease